jgi:two-component system sensor histidine kinase VanS
MHSGIVHNLPDHGTVWVTTSVQSRAWCSQSRTPPELIGTLTEPLQRGTDRVRTDHAGVGLGLAIVNNTTRAHDGTLTLMPRPEGGLGVTVGRSIAPPGPMVEQSRTSAITPPLETAAVARL